MSRREAKPLRGGVGTQEAVQDLLAQEDAYTRTMLASGQFRAEDLVAALEPAFEAARCRVRPRPGDAWRPRILVLRDDAAGDFVLFSPVLRELRRVYPSAEMTLVVSRRNGALARLCPYVDVVVEEQEMPAAFPEMFKQCLLLARFLREFCREEAHVPHPGQTPRFVAFPPQDGVRCQVEPFAHGTYDLVFCPRMGVRSHTLLTAYLTGARLRVGWSQDREDASGKVVALGWDCLLTKPVVFPMLPLHDVDRNLFLLEEWLGLPVVDRRLEVWCGHEDVAAAEAALAPLYAVGLRRVYAVAAAASLPMKQWPPEWYAKVLARIAAEEPDVGFALLGGPADAAAADVVASALGERCVVLAGQVSFRVSAAVIARTQLYIGDDTGMMHLAAAAHVPVLSVNCFPASLQLTPLSIPVRFTPYRVPSVTVMPRVARDGCNDYWRHGCSHEGEPHCILEVSPAAMYAAYHTLVSRVQAGEQRPMIFKA